MRHHSLRRRMPLLLLLGRLEVGERAGKVQLVEDWLHGQLGEQSRTQERMFRSCGARDKGQHVTR